MFKNVLLAIDLNHKNQHQAAIDAAKQHAEMGSQLYVVSVIPLIETEGFVSSFLPQGYDKALIEKGQNVLREFTQTHLSGVDNIKHLVTHGKVYERIVEMAEQLSIDLIITTANNPVDPKHPNNFGPNVARISRNAGCSVLIIR
ncbi:universal stress protein [Ostreibacterium oceani]|uniref:UspA domain-containing protein n=1 Tax=Ostreibacterium oceani TaxID=2654998 RepID=A0A6N7ES42_9GAMM|nr:universal stress protein [Ostreibacterium oceani]MPV85674.1 hypothetical protein [Ostreibacterium oceani]